jgi:hypothetical protein
VTYGNWDCRAAMVKLIISRLGPWMVSEGTPHGLRPLLDLYLIVRIGCRKIPTEK